MLKNITIVLLSLALALSLAFHFLAPKESGNEELEIESPPPTTSSETEPIPDPQPEPAPPPHPRLTALSKIFEETEENSALHGAAIGFCLIGADGKALLEHHADTAQIPASSLKTLTTATALEVLGPQFRFETRLGVSAPDESKKADLILLGGGDPMLSIADFEKWVEGLVKAGMKTVPGRVIGDGRFFTGSSFADFWNWGDIGNGYGSPVSGLNLGHNRFTAVFSPGEAVGEPAQFLGTMPDVPAVSWWNETVTSAEGSGDGITIYGGEHSSVMHLRGSVPLGGELEVIGAVPDPEAFAAYHLRAALKAAEVTVSGEAIGAGQLFLAEEDIPEIAEELHVHKSPPLLDIVTSIHENSDNHETECVYRILGIESGMAPDEVIRSHWAQRGLELSSLRLVDGSGLARADFITPKTLALIQHYAATGPVGKEYVDSLLSTSNGAIHFKAGWMSAVRSYTGLVESEDGPLAFALMVNHFSDGSAVGELQRKVFEALIQTE